MFAYVCTILFTRISLYIISVSRGNFSGIFIRNIHFHHYFWGYFIFIAGLALYRTRWRIPGLVCIGMGTAYIFDELFMIFSFNQIGYWSLLNLLSMVMGLIGLNVIFFLVKDNIDEQLQDLRFGDAGKKMKFFATLAKDVLFSRFGPVRAGEYKPFAFGYLATMAAFIAIVFFSFFVSQRHLARELADDTPPCDIACFTEMF